MAAMVVFASPARADDPRIIDRADYASHLRAMWAGESIANWTGLRTEGLWYEPPFLTDADWNTFPYPSRPWIYLDFNNNDSPWRSDDDTDVEYIYLHAMHTLGVNRLTPEAIRQNWIDHINTNIWVSNASARSLMSIGVRPPMTALAQGLDPAATYDNSLMIDAQLTTEFFGALCPGMPDRALQMADLPIRTTARGHAAHASQFFVVLYALASQVDQSLSGRDQALWLVREARKYIPDTSVAADACDFVVAEFLANPDVNNWELTRDGIYHRYQENSPASGFVYRAWYESTLNFATGIMCLLYGHMDFERTIQIGTLSGWDSDNPTATMGGLIGLVRGMGTFASYPWLSDNFWITRTRDNLPDYTPGPDFDGEDTFTLMGRRMLPIIDREVAAAGGRALAGPAQVDGTPTGTWILPPGGAGDGLSHADALAKAPTRAEMARSATWQVRLAGGTVTPSVSVSGYCEYGYGVESPAVIADGLESDWRGLEELGVPRAYCSTERFGGNPPGVAQAFSVVYDRPIQIASIRFIGGRHFTTGQMQGGWFQSMSVQVFVAGQWETPSLATSPTPSADRPFAIDDFVLTAPIWATGIRVSGLPGGSGAFVTCMELDAFAPEVVPTVPGFDLTGDGRQGIDDLYAWHGTQVSLHTGTAPDERDLLYLEAAIRAGEAAGMAAGR